MKNQNIQRPAYYYEAKRERYNFILSRFEFCRENVWVGEGGRDTHRREAMGLQ